MDIEALRNSPVGSLVPIAGVDPRTQKKYDHFAFLPHSLPQEVDLSQSTWNAVSKASGALGMLKQACTFLPDPSLLVAPALYKEAQATSALEGTYGALPDVLEAQLPGALPKTAELKEINAYVAMARSAFSAVTDGRPITMSLLCQLQNVLATASRRPPPDSGKVREGQVLIGPEGCTVYDARFIPPPGDDRLQAGLDQWERWVTTDRPLPPVVAVAMSHYQFETLHPFSDANGRVGRLLINVQLLQAGSLDAPSLTLSPWLLRRRSEYQDHLLAVSQTGDWNPWVSFFARAVTDQCEAHVKVATDLMAWQGALRNEISQRHWSGVIAELADALIEWPIVTNRVIQDRFDISAPAAKSVTDRLIKIGALIELSGRGRGRIFGAQRVIDLVESL